jgi:hypothetical protein
MKLLTYSDNPYRNTFSPVSMPISDSILILTEELVNNSTQWKLTVILFQKEDNKKFPKLTARVKKVLI